MSSLTEALGPSGQPASPKFETGETQERPPCFKACYDAWCVVEEGKKARWEKKIEELECKITVVTDPGLLRKYHTKIHSLERNIEEWMYGIYVHQCSCPLCVYYTDREPEGVYCYSETDTSTGSNTESDTGSDTDSSTESDTGSDTDSE
jgi:hypothetical protein